MRAKWVRIGEKKSCARSHAMWSTNGRAPAPVPERGGTGDAWFRAIDLYPHPPTTECVIGGW